MATQIRVRRDTLANWTGVVPANGEPIGIIGADGKVTAYKIGDGITPAEQLPALSKGDKGDAGVQGQPGTNGVATDDAVASNIGTPGTNTNTALYRYQTVNAANYRTGLGVIDQTSITNAAAAAGAGGTIFIPRSATVRITAAVSLTDISIVSDGAVILVPNDLGAGVVAISIAGSGSHPMTVLEGFQVQGPAAAGGVGTKPASMHGVQVTGQARPKVRNVRIRGFDRGFVARNDVGHLYWDRVDFTANYYGLYIAKDTSDYFVTDSSLNGNRFAGIATPADQGIDGFHFQNSHIGFQPYGIYQEATTEAGSTQQGSPKVFLQDGILDHARFESIGNAAIYSAATNDATNKSSVNAVKILQPGHSWNSAYKIANLPRDYAIDAGFLDRTLEIEAGAAPFLAGDIGVIHFKQCSSTATVSLRGMTAAASQLSVDSGTPIVVAGVINAVAAPLHPYISGAYYSAPGTRITSNRPNGVQTFMPIQITSRRVFTGIAAEVATAGVAGSQLRLSIYQAAGGKPGALMFDADVVAADSTGIKVVSGLTLDLAAGWYFLAVTVLNASTTPLPVLRCLTGVLPGAPVYSSGNTLATGAGWNLSGQTSAAASGSAATTTDTVIAAALLA